MHKFYFYQDLENSNNNLPTLFQEHLHLFHPVLFRYYKNYLLTLNSKKYCLTITKNASKNCVQLTRNEKLGTLLTNAFLTLTGGVIYYDFRNSLKQYQRATQISFQKNN